MLSKLKISKCVNNKVSDNKYDCLAAKKITIKTIINEFGSQLEKNKHI